MNGAADDRVRAQYEAYPYPERDPADERRRLVVGSPSHLDEIVHYVLGGRREGPLRALVAGGGTGDGAIMLAQQLAWRRLEGEVVHLDVSTAARAIAEARAKVRGLTNLAFVTGSLLDAPRLGLGRFDYIDCCGVLHHLADPAAGLARLVEVLAPEGGLGLMVYGALGRTGVYPVQAMLRALADDLPDRARLDLARRLLAGLPETNWLKRNPFVTDHLEAGDAGLYDLLLHRRDRAFTIPEIAALVAGAGLAITGLIEPALYQPERYLDDAEILARLEGLDWIARAGFAEALSGAMKRHVFYAVPAGRARSAVARADGANAVPVLREHSGAELGRRLAGGGRLTVALDGLTVRARIDPTGAAILAAIDGRRSLGEIHRRLGGDLDWFAFKAAFDSLYASLGAVNVMLLASASRRPRPAPPRGGRAAP